MKIRISGANWASGPSMPAEPPEVWAKAVEISIARSWVAVGRAGPYFPPPVRQAFTGSRALPQTPDQPALDHLPGLLTRIAEALERLAPPPPAGADLTEADAFVWHPAPPLLAPVREVSRVAIDLLQGVDRQRTILLENTLRFARGLPANN